MTTTTTLASLTRRLSHLAVTNSAKSPIVTSPSIFSSFVKCGSTTLHLPQQQEHRQQQRFRSTLVPSTARLPASSVVGGSKNDKDLNSFLRLGLGIRCASSNAGGSGGDGAKKKGKQAKNEITNTQHEEWVKFQKSISVQGFETGQTTSVTRSALLGRKDRGGKVARKRRERELSLAQKTSTAQTTTVGSGQFPSLRYSDEETERLLSEAYANIPPKTGKRGTRNLKRQKLRWWKARKQHAQKKMERIREHENRMLKRSRIAQECREVRRDAEETRVREREYQESVLKGWALRMGLEVVGDEGVGVALEERQEG